MSTRSLFRCRDGDGGLQLAARCRDQPSRINLWQPLAPDHVAAERRPLRQTEHRRHGQLEVSPSRGRSGLGGAAGRPARGSIGIARLRMGGQSREEQDACRTAMSSLDKQR
jgi:hypothetical protein